MSSLELDLGLLQVVLLVSCHFYRVEQDEENLGLWHLVVPNVSRLVEQAWTKDDHSEIVEDECIKEDDLEVNLVIPGFYFPVVLRPYLM
jgi:hypothetical protein